MVTKHADDRAVSLLDTSDHPRLQAVERGLGTAGGALSGALAGTVAGAHLSRAIPTNYPLLQALSILGLAGAGGYAGGHMGHRHVENQQALDALVHNHRRDRASAREAPKEKTAAYQLGVQHACASYNIR